MHKIWEQSWFKSDIKTKFHYLKVLISILKRKTRTSCQDSRIVSKTRVKKETKTIHNKDNNKTKLLYLYVSNALDKCRFPVKSFSKYTKNRSQLIAKTVEFTCQWWNDFLLLNTNIYFLYQMLILLSFIKYYRINRFKHTSYKIYKCLDHEHKLTLLLILDTVFSLWNCYSFLLLILLVEFEAFEPFNSLLFLDENACISP